MNTLTIRKATLNDLPDVMTLIGQSDMSPDNVLSLEQAQELFQRISQTGCHHLYVVELESSIVGTFALIVVQQLSHNGAKSIIIEDIVVASAVQGQGIGQAIMKFASEEAQSLGAYKICLSRGLARTKAHAFYERMGYKQDGYRFAVQLEANTSGRRSVTLDSVIESYQVTTLYDRWR
jgi:GNAT superfamily N-acetyltransferase